ncbi:hypothetical protein GPECTOR_10g792 [Gonium pectorale]|uniref:Uncharacterized protein n=1 Tax=Gonium pectorale TaxID=33097 RepID=A0A150GQU9_GONPE|nr:hypothetical protein GPECTOR_10g792 [Gonium pectorale]|eukprot:KXZ52163.1 hypothetical protein GPECTOR_10g792 [Gonium pectorale]
MTCCEAFGWKGRDLKGQTLQARFELDSGTMLTWKEGPDGTEQSTLLSTISDYTEPNGSRHVLLTGLPRDLRAELSGRYKLGFKGDPKPDLSGIITVVYSASKVINANGCGEHQASAPAATVSDAGGLGSGVELLTGAAATSEWASAGRKRRGGRRQRIGTQSIGVEADGPKPQSWSSQAVLVEELTEAATEVLAVLTRVDPCDDDLAVLVRCLRDLNSARRVLQSLEK